MAKNSFVAIFIVFWPYLLTTKLRSVILHNIGHSNALVKLHYEKKLTKNIRPTDILQIYTSI